jgi:3-oxoacyl-(acyl-carrier-protein) synthase
MAANGCGVDAVWAAVRAGRSGLKPLSLFQSPRYGQLPAGEIQADLRALGAPVNGSRSDQLGWLAAREAVVAARIDISPVADRAGVVMGCSVGGSYNSEQFLTRLIKEGKMRARPTRYHECASVVELLARDFGLHGPSLAVTTACSSSALAIAAAAEMIMAGEADVMLAGGADSLSRMTWGGFHSLLLVDAAGCRPFDVQRAGTSLGEGAGVLVLEAEEFARRRGAPILARLTGWGASCDAYHTTAPHPEGAGAVAAMKSALRRAGLDPAAINYINAHGTGTRDNDLAEARALSEVFAGQVPPFSSTKQFFGHALGASGAIEAVICVAALRHGEIPPNAGFQTPDPAIGLQPVTAFQRAELTHVMSNSFGFGGNNGVLIFSRPEVTPLTRPPASRPLAITGLGVIGPGTLTLRDIQPPLPPGTVRVHSCGPLADSALLTPNQRRRLGRLVQMALLAARRSHPPDPAQRTGVAIGTGLGCLEDAGAFLENLIAKEEREPMPARFPNSVHNAPAAQTAIDQGARALNTAPTSGEISFESALWLGARQLAVDEADCMLVGAVDELNKYPLALGRRWGFWDEDTRPGEGGMVASLQPLDTPLPALPVLARLGTVRLGRAHQPFDAAREAEWIAGVADLAGVTVFLSGAGGWPALDDRYAAVATALSVRAGRPLEHHTYKQHCGEFQAASAFGFSVAVELVRARQCGVLLYTLSPRGARAVCTLQP